MGTGDPGTGANADTVVTTIVVSNRRSFVSNLALLCLLPAPRKLWKANLVLANGVKSQILHSS